MRFRVLSAALLVFCFCSIFLVAQQESKQAVPHFVRFAGTLSDRGGAGTLGMTFVLYKDQTGSAPLWQEVQNVTVDAGGQYSVLLGANSKDGVPAELFTSSEVRWLGVQVEQEPEQPRVLLVSVPYALKAGDAETVGGHPLSDFVLSATTDSSTSTGSTGTTSASSTKSLTTRQSSIVPLAGTVGAGSLFAVAKYDSSGNLLGSNLVFDTGAALGVGTQSPQAALDVNYSTAPASGVTPYAFRAINAITVGQTNNSPQNNFSSVYSGTGTQGSIYGLVNNIQKTGTGPISNAFGVLSSVQNLNATGAIANAYAFVAQAPVTTGSITNSYAFYAEDSNSINYFAGKVGIGTNTPSGKLDVQVTTPTPLNTINSAMTLTNSSPNPTDIVTSLKLAVIDASTATNVSKQTMRMSYVRDASATGGVSIFDTIFTATPVINSDAPYTLIGLNMEAPTVATGKTLSTFYGALIGAGGGGTVANRYALVTAPGAGNVGLNTTTPIAPLNLVADNPGGSGRATQMVVQGGSNPNLKLNIGIHTEASPAYAELGLVEEGVAWRNLVLARNGGAVGIGTSTPTSLLTVNGTIQSTSGGFKFPDGSTQTVAAVSNAVRAGRSSGTAPSSANVNWSPAFADANYTVTCTSEGASAGAAVITSHVAASVTASVSGTGSYTLHCIAYHD